MSTILDLIKTATLTREYIDPDTQNSYVWIAKSELSAAQREEFVEFEVQEGRVRFPDGSRTMAVMYDLTAVQANLVAEAKELAAAKKLKAEAAKSRQQVEVLSSQLEEAQSIQGLLEIAANSVLNSPLAAPSLNIRSAHQAGPGLFDGKLAGTAVMALSDLHFEEFVDAKEIRGFNHYNIDVAQKRLDTVMESAANILLTHTGGTYHDRFVILLNGDLVSGEIHDELTRTNSASLQETIFVLAQKLFQNIMQYANEFREVEVLCTPGNHGRMDHKWSAKGSAERSWDMMVGRILKKMVEASGRKNVNVHLADGADMVFDIYGFRCLVEHGNSIKTTGDAIAGFITSAVRRKLKLHERESNLGRLRGDPTRGVDYMFIGHFHTLEVFRGVIANGSLIGTNEYAMQGAFRPEPPQQVLVNFHPEHSLNQVWAVQATQCPAIKGAAPFVIPDSRIYTGE